MTTKLRAAKLATAAGADTYIINGASCENLYTLLEESIEEDPPIPIKEGGILKEGYH